MNPIRDKRPGIATSSKCFRPGEVSLLSNDGEFGVIPTNCKTWRCKGCRDRMLALFRARVSIGCSTLVPSAFMTGTYEADSRLNTDASYVARDWRALWRIVHRRNPWTKDLKWLRVMELTRRGIPHWHLVLGTIHGSVRCWQGDKLSIRSYEKRFDTCECLAHVFARAWYSVTGDSYIVHTRPVVGHEKAAAYMAKYVSKTFGEEGRMAALGMKRRWSSSRGWPGSGKLRLQVTEDEDWKERYFRYGRVACETEDAGTFTRVGDDATREYFEKASSKRPKQDVIRRLSKHA